MLNDIEIFQNYNIINKLIAKLLPLVTQYNINNRDDSFVEIESSIGGLFGSDLQIRIIDISRYKTEQKLDSEYLVTLGSLADTQKEFDEVIAKLKRLIQIFSIDIDIANKTLLKAEFEVN